jgi:hypothetical protein
MVDHCSFCYSELAEGADLCAHCGMPRAGAEASEQIPQEAKPEPTLARCPACGTDQPAWTVFCRECGHAMGEQEAAPTVSNEIVLAPALESSPAAEAETLLETMAGTAGLPGQFSEYPSGSGALPPGYPGGAVPWRAVPVVPQPALKRPRQRPAFLKRLTPRVIATIVAVLVVLSGLGTAGYILTRPHPVIQVTVNQRSVSAVSGSPDTDLSVAGHDFTPDSTVAFLLDGAAAPGAANVTSNHDGAITALLTITDDWTFKTHALTARDAKGYITKAGVTVRVLPQPLLKIYSQYTKGSTPAGSTGTNFQVGGKRFTPHTAVTLLLDGKPLTLDQALISDDKGQISIALLVTSKWTLGGHALTAQDAKGYLTQGAAALVVVRQGEADTPGPNGAPADDASFGISFNVQARSLSTGKTISFSVFADVTGRADPAGGTVCYLAYDDNQPHTFTGHFSDGESYTETITSTCAGSYKSGKISYIETVTSDRIVLASGLVCSTHRAYISNALAGTYTTSGFKGDYYSNGEIIPCNGGGLEIVADPYVGTWTGTISA